MTYPVEQSPHVVEPTVFVHVRLLSQPPLLVRHSFTSLQPFAPSLTYPLGQSPHVMDPTVFAHMRLLSQPPLLDRHSFKSLQPLAPSLTYPLGQSPHLADPAAFVHVRLLSQPPLLDRHGSTVVVVGAAVVGHFKHFATALVTVFVFSHLVAKRLHHPWK